MYECSKIMALSKSIESRLYHHLDILYYQHPLLNQYTPQQSTYKMDAVSIGGGDSKMSAADNSKGKMTTAFF